MAGGNNYEEPQELFNVYYNVDEQARLTVMSSQMRYENPKTLLFVRVGNRLMQGMFERFMMGIKNQGQVSSRKELM